MKEIINLPLWESIKRTYIYFFVNFKTVVKLSALWVGLVFLCDCLLSFPSLCTGSYCHAWGNKFFMLLQIVAVTAVSVSFSRQIILRESKNWRQISLSLKELKYLGYSLLILLLIIISAVISGVVTALIFGIDLRTPAVSMPSQSLILYFVLVLIATIYSSRLSLILPSIAVENKEMTLLKSFQITQGNSLKLFLGIIFSTLPTMILLMFLGTLMQVLQIEGILGQMLFSFLGISLSLINALLKACYLSHVYQYFMYFYNQQQEEEAH